MAEPAPLRGESGTCPACSDPVPVGARFCPSCGTPLQTETVAEERRVVTVLFADLVGFTNRAEGLDPEAVKELLDAAFGVLVPVIDAHGGHVDKIIGDELMAVFGAPTSFHDDPERAVRAALSLHPALRTVARDLELRVAVHTGEVLAGPVGPAGVYTVTGDTVNTAHRLVTSAAPGEILVGARTHDVTESVIDYDSRPPYTLRGKHDEVRAWAARGVATPTALLPIVLVGEVPVIGRDEELRELTALARRALEEPTATVVAIVGEPGVGKTDLAAEVLRAVTDLQPLVLRGRCRSYGTHHRLSVAADIVRTALGIRSAHPLELQRASVRRAAVALGEELGTDVGTLERRLVQLLNLGAESQRVTAPLGPPPWSAPADEVLAAVAIVLEGATRRQPVVLVLDGLHLADPMFLAFLARLPARLGPQALLVLGLGRDDLLERRPNFALRAPGVVVFPLRPLSTADSRALLHTRLSYDGRSPTSRGESEARPEVLIGPETERVLLEAAGGNPLLIEELVRHLIQQGLVTQVGNEVQVALVGDEVGLPEEARTLLWSRIDALPPGERRALLAAAVVGPRFWSEAVAYLGHPDADAALRSLVARGLIEPVEDQGDGDHAFRQHLAREAAYAAIPLIERASGHASLSRWLDARLAGDGTGIVAGLLADHADQAVRLSRELDREDPELCASAFSALLSAGDSAERFASYREADGWYRRALEVGSPDSALVQQVELARGRVLVHLRHLDEAEAVLAGLLAAPQATSALLAEARTWHAVVARLTGDVDRARAAFHHAVAERQALDDRDGELVTRRLQGWSELLAGRPRAARPHLRHAVELVTGTTPAEEHGETLRCLGWCMFLLGESSAPTILEEAATLLVEAGDVGGAAWCLGILGFAQFQQGELEAAARTADLLLREANARRDAWGAAVCHVLLAATHMERGELDDATELAAQANRAFRELDDAWGRALAGLVAGETARLAGRLGEARAHLEQALAHSAHVAYVGEETRILAELAQVALAEGDLSTATDQARRTLALVRSGIGATDSEVRVRRVLAAIAGQAGQPEAAIEQLTEALLAGGAGPEAGEAGELSSSTRQAACELAILRAGAGDVAAAELLVHMAEQGPTESAITRAALDAARAAVGASGSRRP